MRKYARRFIYRNTDGERFPLYLYLMMAYTLSMGVAFVFFGNTTSVQASVLYNLTTDIALVPAVSLWGVAAIAAVGLTAFNLLARYRPISSWGPILGYLVWVYAAVVYLTHGFWLQFIAAFIWLCFWALHHVRLIGYRHAVDAGYEDPPE